MQIDMAGLSVMLAMPCDRDIPPATCHALLETERACARAGIDLEINLQLGSTVFHARSLAAHNFLKGRFNRFFQVDSDMVWTADDFLRVLALSTKMDCVCATYTGRTIPPVFFITLLNDDPKNIETNQYGCMSIGGVGLGFTIASRELIQKLADNAPKITLRSILPGEYVAKIFRFDEVDDDARGEDMAFFADVRSLGYTVNLDPSISLGHVGSYQFRGSFSEHLVTV